MKKILSYLTFYDKFFLLVIVSLCLFFILLPFRSVFTGANNGKDQMFVIQSVDGIKEIPINETFTPEPEIIAVEGPTGTTFIEVHQGKIRVKKEPEEHIYRIAERQGWIDSSGFTNTIINLPNKISIQIKDNEQAELDGITR